MIRGGGSGQLVRGEVQVSWSEEAQVSWPEARFRSVGQKGKVQVRWSEGGGSGQFVRGDVQVS